MLHPAHELDAAIAAFEAGERVRGEPRWLDAACSHKNRGGRGHRFSGGAPVDLAAELTAIFAAVSWVTPGILLIRDEDDMDLVSGKVATLFNHGSGSDAVQANDTWRPTFSSTAINGRPGLTHAAGHFVLTGSINLNAYTAGILSVLFQDSDAAARIPAGFGNFGGAATNTHWGIVTNASAGQLDGSVRGQQTNQARSAASYPMTSPGIVTATVDVALSSAEAEIWHNSVNVTASRPTDNNNVNPLGNAGIVLGANVFGSSGITGASGGLLLAAGTGPISGDVLAAMVLANTRLLESKDLA